jgi:hypothetical protein
MKDWEKASLTALYKLCPLCGTVGKDCYCQHCDFTWEEGKVYFSGGDTLSWKKGGYIDLDKKP